MTDQTLPPMDKLAFETLANFRYEIRKFLRFSENVTRKAGITPLQYLMLLNIKGYPGRDWATVGELAERLQAQHHGVVALVSRCEKQGFVERRRSTNRTRLRRQDTAAVLLLGLAQPKHLSRSDSKRRAGAPKK